MKPKIYKAKFDKDYIVDYLNKNLYQEFGKTIVKKEENVQMTLFFDIHEKKAPQWMEDLRIFFSLKELVSNPLDQYNAVIVVETQNSIYLLPFGKAHWKVESISDTDFGLNFAEKSINTNDITLKSVNYIERNIMQGVLNYKKGQIEFPQVSESYKLVSGRPENDKIYGTSIDCGTGITLSKSFVLSSTNTDFFNLFNEIDNTISSDKIKSTIPKMKQLSSKDPLCTILNKKLLDMLISQEELSSLALNISRIQIMDNRVEIIENSERLKLYLVNRKKETEQDVELDSDNVIKFIKTHAEHITSIDQMRFTLAKSDDSTTSALPFLKLIFCEIMYDGKNYILNDGKWSYFNDRFYKLLEQKLEEINSVVNFESQYSIEYESAKSGELVGEGGYIEKISQNPDIVKLHKRNLSISGSTIEIADIYHKNIDELFAIKRGTKTSLAMYSFEQAILSMHALINHTEFDVINELQKYNNRDIYNDSKKYPDIDDNCISNIVGCKNSSVLWLVDDTTSYVYDGVKNKTFKLNEFKSLLLKLKIVDWYSFIKENGYNPKLYFALDLPIEKSNN